MLTLTVATGRYDRTQPLHDGRVRPEGVTVNWLTLNEEEIFWRMQRHLEFDASELSLSGYIIRLDRGQRDLIGIPVFPSRAFRHSSIYVNAKARIVAPRDLVSRPVGVPDYQMTAAVWVRGILEDDYGVDPRSIDWVQGGLEQAGRLPIEPVKPEGVSLRTAPEGKTLSDMLASGEIHALVSPRAPSSYGGTSRVRRLFRDPWRAERDFFKRTRIFPIMHVVAVKRALVDSNPWLPQSLVKAFTAAKDMSEASLRTATGGLPVALPFLHRHVEETIDLMGEDFWPYGVEPNRPTIEAFLRYSKAQGLIGSEPAVDDLFPASTRLVSRI